MASKIEQIIDEIQEYIDSCKYTMMSSSIIKVNKDELDELLSELKRATPDEIKRYQKIISNKEAILGDAKQRADAMIAQAQDFQSQMVNENSIMQQAYAQAAEIVNAARTQANAITQAAVTQANEIQLSAMQYTDGSLESIQAILSQAMHEAQEKNASYVESLNRLLTVVNANRSELHSTDTLETGLTPAQQSAPQGAAAAAPSRSSSRHNTVAARTASEFAAAVAASSGQEETKGGHAAADSQGTKDDGELAVLK